MADSEKTTQRGRPGDPPPGKPYISGARGRHAGRLFPVEPGLPLLLGRNAECMPRFPLDESVSKVHAEVFVGDAGSLWLRDMSRNGTSVSGTLVHGERMQLRHGDSIVLGKATDVLRAEWLTDAEVEFRLLPFIDPLTGIGTNRHLATRLADVLDSREDMDEPLSVLMIDVDHFGRFNKSHGQQAGDAVLRAFASCLRDTVRELHPAGDAVRHGGEEFLVMLPRCPLPLATRVAEACREAVERLPIEHDGRTLSVTASFGAATCRPRKGLAVADLVALANPQLVRAKESGRNRTRWPGDDALPPS
jgi:diguanylate cyclase (GGDEF)-like protein